MRRLLGLICLLGSCSTLRDATGSWALEAVSAVAVDSRGEIYAFHRGAAPDPIVVFDPTGKILRSWGRGLFRNPHGLRIDRHDHVWVTDSGDHQVLEFTRDGTLLRCFGVRGESGVGTRRFNGPTDVAFAPTGEFYVADGYGNSRIVKFSATGAFLKDWGEKGTAPGEFDVPHSVAVDSKGRVYVADRENSRIQIFDAEGRFLRQWAQVGAVQCLSIPSSDELWALSFRTPAVIQEEEHPVGRILRLDLETGRLCESVESPGHWLHAGSGGDLLVADLAGRIVKVRR